MCVTWNTSASTSTSTFTERTFFLLFECSKYYNTWLVNHAHISVIVFRTVNTMIRMRSVHNNPLVSLKSWVLPNWTQRNCKISNKHQFQHIFSVYLFVFRLAGLGWFDFFFVTSENKSHHTEIKLTARTAKFFHTIEWCDWSSAPAIKRKMECVRKNREKQALQWKWKMSNCSSGKSDYIVISR